MGSAKLVVFAVFLILGQSSLALESTSSCEVRTGVKNPLKVFQFGKETAHEAVQRVNTILYDQIRSIFLELSLGAQYEKGYITKDDIALEKLVTAYMIGIEPFWQALHIIQPTLNVTLRTEQTRVAIVNIAQKLYDSIELIRSKNYKGSLPALASNQEAADVKPLVALVFAPMTSQTDLTAKDKNLLACYQDSVDAGLTNTSILLFDTIRAVLAQVPARNPDKIKNTLSLIEEARAKSSAYFATEVEQKYEAMGNVYLAKFLKKTGILHGLFAIQSAQGTPAF